MVHNISLNPLKHLWRYILLFGKVKKALNRDFL
jgi:hypothetical protein